MLIKVLRTRLRVHTAVSWRATFRDVALTALTTILVALSANAQGDATMAGESRRVAEDNQIVTVRAGAPSPLRAQLDGPAWATADSMTTFRQLDPDEGAPASERTVVKVLRDEDALVIGVRAYDREPAGIRASQLRRDADLSFG